MFWKENLTLFGEGRAFDGRQLKILLDGPKGCGKTAFVKQVLGEGSPLPPPK